MCFEMRVVIDYECVLNIHKVNLNPMTFPIHFSPCFVAYKIVGKVFSLS